MHGGTAGAGGAVLKAWFDPDFLIPKFVPSAGGTQLVATGNKTRVGDEIDELVSNIAYFRLGAGVHYNSDCAGCELGENIAIRVLRDLVKRYPYATGFRFRKRNGDINNHNAVTKQTEETQGSSQRMWYLL
jgi:hypothetical protein